MSLQVHSRSEELGVSKAAGLPYERNARTNVQRRSVVKVMSEPVRGREQPANRRAESFYIIHEEAMLMDF